MSTTATMSWGFSLYAYRHGQFTLINYTFNSLSSRSYFLLLFHGFFCRNSSNGLSQTICFWLKLPSFKSSLSCSRRDPTNSVQLIRRENMIDEQKIWKIFSNTLKVEKRKELTGTDPIKAKFVSNYLMQRCIYWDSNILIWFLLRYHTSKILRANFYLFRMKFFV